MSGYYCPKCGRFEYVAHKYIFPHKCTCGTEMKWVDNYR